MPQMTPEEAIRAAGEHLGIIGATPEWLVEAVAAEAELNSLLRKQLAEAAKPYDEDKKDDWSKRIDADHPTRAGNVNDVKRHERYYLAMQLVGNRHSKYALVDLVNHLIAEKERVEAKLNVANGALKAIANAFAVFPSGSIVYGDRATVHAALEKVAVALGFKLPLTEKTP